MKIVSKQCFLCNKLAENYKMHIMLRSFNLLENRERLFENILNILDENEYVDFENQTIEKQYITLLGCTNNTSFEKITFGKWKQITSRQCVSLYVYKIRNLFTFDCWCLLNVSIKKRITPQSNGPLICLIFVLCSFVTLFRQFTLH